MKIMQRAILKIVPGKTDEAIELLKKEDEFRKKVGAKPWRAYRCIAGRNAEDMNTFYFDTDWDSLEEFEKFVEKFVSIPEMTSLTERWKPIVASHEMEFYTIIENL